MPASYQDETKKYVIIVAGGKGLRMGTSMPKQFISIGGKPVLMHTINRFHTYDSQLHIILVLPKEHQSYWQELCKLHHFDIRHQIADGGATRFQSVRNGLALIPNKTKGQVGIHDGVRPFVSSSTIDRCYTTAQALKSAIPVLPVTDSIRLKQSNNESQALDRSHYCLVQTPQVFDISLLKHAYEQAEDALFTDDASVVERLSIKVALVDGNRENIKLTTPFDLRLAELLLTDDL